MDLKETLRVVACLGLCASAAACQKQRELPQQLPARIERFLDHSSRLTFSVLGKPSLVDIREPATQRWSAPEIESVWHRSKDGNHIILRSPRLRFQSPGDIESIRIRFAGFRNLTRFSMIWSDQPELTRSDLLQRRRDLEVSGSPPSKEFLVLGDDLSDFQFPGGPEPEKALVFLFLRLPDNADAVLESVEIRSLSGLLATRTSGWLRHSRRGEVRDALYIRTPGRVSYEADITERADLLFGIRSLRPGAKIHLRVLLETRPRNPRNITERVFRSPLQVSRILLDEMVPSDDTWQDFRVLLRGAGKQTRIILFAESSAGDDLVLWSNPMLVFHSPPGRRPNVILYVVDALRADHLGYAGYGLSTSPVLDKMAAAGTIFRRCYAQAPWTKPSAATLLTSLYPQTHAVGARASTDILPFGVYTLQESMRRNGYVTAQFSANPLSSTLSNLDQGFDYVFTPGFFSSSKAGPRRGKIHSDDLNEAILPWIDAHAGDPFFVYIHSIDPHQPYSSPEVPSHLKSQRTMTSPYDAEVFFNDRQIGVLYERLTQSGLAANTLFIVTADHGEAFYEHNQWGHGLSVYEEEVRVPLLMLQPGVVPHRVVDQPVQLVDIMPTILKHCAIPFENGVLQGQDLFGNSGSQGRPVFLSRYFYPEDAEIEGFGSEDCNSIIESPWKLIVTRRVGSSRPQFELYNLDDDSGEKSNLASKEPDVVARLYDHLGDFLRDQQKKRYALHGVHGAQGTVRPRIPQDTVDLLRSLGYAR